METYATALLVAIPLFMILIIIETVYGVIKGEQTLNSMDTISSLSSGITNVIKDSLGIVLVIVSYPWMLKYLAVYELEAGWVLYLVAFIAVDFAGYCTHRLNHSVNFFWNAHVIHHSSEEFNLPCALRQSISNLLGVYSIFLVPAAVVGVPVQVITLIAPVHLFLQFWYHTRHIPKLGWLEYVIITPSQHRVHHAINAEYLDKNLGQIFSLWDRLFGTFQEELDDVPPVYGITRPAATWNPVKINFQHLWLLITDAWRAESWWDKARVWFMPTGWRPAGMEDRYPVAKIDDPSDFKKYKPPVNRFVVAWSWFQFSATSALLMLMLAYFGEIGRQGLIYYSAFLFVGIYGFTSVMDRLPSAVWIEVLRGVAGVAFVLQTGGWFGLESSLPGVQYVVLAYFMLTPLGALICGREVSAAGFGPENGLQEPS